MPQEIFVFGSNLAGIHGAGAAKWAHENCHAVMGEGIGRTGSAYAIPTKDMDIKPMPLDDIEHHVAVFLDYAHSKPHLMFRVSRVGCGLAGYKDKDIAPMFVYAPNNCIMPVEWIPFLERNLRRPVWKWESGGKNDSAAVESKERSIAEKFRTSL